jgi:hypothetical protein
MKIPFLNRKKYILLKCYTWHAGAHRQTPITMSIKPVRQRKTEFMEPVRDFSGCWSRVKSQQVSATVPCSTEIRFSANGDNYVNAITSSEAVTVSFDHNEDITYPLKDMVLSKIELPWRCEEDAGVNFVMARHMQCRSPLNILSGVLANAFPINFFNLTNTHEHQFSVKPNEPVISLYPMSDLPLQIETYYDPDKFKELDERNYMSHFRSTGLKTKGRVNV